MRKPKKPRVDALIAAQVDALNAANLALDAEISAYRGALRRAPWRWPCLMYMLGLHGAASYVARLAHRLTHESPVEHAEGAIAMLDLAEGYEAQDMERVLQEHVAARKRIAKR